MKALDAACGGVPFTMIVADDSEITLAAAALSGGLLSQRRLALLPLERSTLAGRRNHIHFR